VHIFAVCLAKLDVNLKPQSGLLDVNLASRPVDWHVEVLNSDLALREYRAKESRERFQDRCLACSVRP
jgi:predicted secreted hydrolase